MYTTANFTRPTRFELRAEEPQGEHLGAMCQKPTCRNPAVIEPVPLRVGHTDELKCGPASSVEQHAQSRSCRSRSRTGWRYSSRSGTRLYRRRQGTRRR